MSKKFNIKIIHIYMELDKYEIIVIINQELRIYWENYINANVVEIILLMS